MTTICLRRAWMGKWFEPCAQRRMPSKVWTGSIGRLIRLCPESVQNLVDSRPREQEREGGYEAAIHRKSKILAGRRPYRLPVGRRTVCGTCGRRWTTGRVETANMGSRRPIGQRLLVARRIVDRV